MRAGLVALLALAAVALALPAPALAAKSCGNEVPTITGTSGPDTLHGTKHHDVIRAGRGDDLIEASGGDDKICGNADDQALGSVGWDGGSCPNFEQGSCTGAIADCSGIGECLACVGTRATTEAIALAYDAYAPAPAGGPVQKCQREMGKRTAKYFQSQSKALAKCESQVLLGMIAGPCPDAAAAQPAIAKAAAKQRDTICKACGGGDKVCGTGDDLTPGTIGLPASCPAVTVPGGASCSRPISTLCSSRMPSCATGCSGRWPTWRICAAAPSGKRPTPRVTPSPISPATC